MQIIDLQQPMPDIRWECAACNTHNLARNLPALYESVCKVCRAWVGKSNARILSLGHLSHMSIDEFKLLLSLDPDLGVFTEKTFARMANVEESTNESTGKTFE